ncbi:Bacterial regulatory proteins, tetR family [Pseudoruegeria aquimaris]|uniref:Bacterial regulatory proteins, tetR family n=1 Tax=Pseudoruegeria aquimaris TaxID=393663 RepID=A0A1Y5RF91_9RHOB|nr:TetR/AcrR family transcriptional regulator [Pseudoruegeria aquimaris]SLN16100.1 Bacterial regulatory proteins, tetR family [Pseudoruegeria aquimaris]
MADPAPSDSPPLAHTKATREDWLRAARDVLVSDGVGEVKILPLSTRLGVSRSSFYWYFKSRTDLLEALLAEWEAHNTATIETHCALPATSIAEAVCNFFTCFVDPELFDQGLDFAVREWARRDPGVRARIDSADARRIEAVTAMFVRQGYPADEADARARILYFMQLGYHALDVREPMELRLSRIEHYLTGFTGTPPNPAVVAAFRARFLPEGP